MAELTNKRSLNIFCKIGNIDISNKCIDSFEVERTCSDLADKFTMTLVDSPDTTITYDLEMYMAGGYRDIKIKYGDVENDSFTSMQGTIYNYSYNFVGNIKTLTISGICSAFASSNIVGSTKYNIDWNTYVYHRQDPKKPWNIIPLQNVSYDLGSKNFAIQDNKGVNGADLTNSYILNTNYREYLYYNSTKKPITSPVTGNTIYLPVPDLFIQCQFPLDVLQDKSKYDHDTGRISDTSYINNYQDPDKGYASYYEYCNNNSNLWGWLTPYIFNIDEVNVSKEINALPRKCKAENQIKTNARIIYSHGDYGHSGPAITVPENTTVGFRSFKGNAQDFNLDCITLKDDFGQDVWFRLDKDSSTTDYWSLDYNSGGFGYISVATSDAVNAYPIPPKKTGYLDEYYDYLRNTKDLWGELKVTSINKKAYLINDDNQVISLELHDVAVLEHRWTPSNDELSWAYVDLGTIKNEQNRKWIIDTINKTFNKKAYWPVAPHTRTPAYKITNNDLTMDVLSTNRVSQLVWKDNSGNIRAFQSPTDKSLMFIQVAPGSKYYSQGSFVTLGAGVDPSHIVSELAKLEGWYTAGDKYIAQTATLSNSENWIMNHESAIDFITDKLIPSSVTVAGIYKNKKGDNIYLTSAKAGYSIWFDDANILHYHPISSGNIDTTDIHMGYNYPNSPVLTFSVNTKGTAFYTQATHYYSTLSIVTGQEYNSVAGLTNADVYAVADSTIHNSFLDQWYGTTYQEVENKGFTESSQVEAFYNKLLTTDYSYAFVKSGSSSKAEIQANMSTAMENIHDFTITGSMSIIGDSRIKPFKNLKIVNMVKGAGYSNYSANSNSFSGKNYASNEPVIHPSSGIYLILTQTDKFSASAGFVQELNLIRQTKDLDALLDEEIDFGIKAAFWYEGEEPPIYVGKFTWSAND